MVKHKKMKQIKLQVGKTYRSREGEEVKIVRKGNRGWDYWVGSNGEWYYESGKWSYVTKEHPDDLVEEVTSETRHAFAIPNGAKEVTVEQIGNRIIVEVVPEEAKELKPGDVMVNEKGSVYIFRGEGDSVLHDNYCVLFNDGKLGIGCQSEIGRLATPEESKPLFDALKKAGKRWNPETMQVEDIPEIDHIREWVETHLNDGYYNQQGIAEVIEHYLKYREGEK